MMGLLLNHLWQSTLCAGMAGLLALGLHRNSASVRFWVWFAASIKFLVPFVALTVLSASLFPPVISRAAVPEIKLVQPFTASSSARQTFSNAVHVSSQQRLPERRTKPTVSPRLTPTIRLDIGIALLWLIGCTLLLLRRALQWLHVRALLRASVQVQADAPIPIKVAASRLEPGLVGIFRPTILLPLGIADRLSLAEFSAVISHELCHWRRNDNLLAAIHMLVEILFWFFPPVWVIGRQLNAEREQACDESVLAQGTDPHTYAEGILKVCRAYLQSPLSLVSGVSGADLTTRIEKIAENRAILDLNAVRKVMLSSTAAIAIALPLAVGLITAPAMPREANAAPVSAQSEPTARSLPAQDNSSVPSPNSENVPTGASRQVEKPTSTASTASAETAALQVPRFNLPDIPTAHSTRPDLVASNDLPTTRQLDQNGDNQESAKLDRQSNEYQKSALAKPSPSAEPSRPTISPTSAMVCEPRELISISRDLGRNLCVQSDILSNLDEAKGALEAAARSFVDRPNNFDASAWNRAIAPHSSPDSITCGSVSNSVESRLPTTVDCAYNSYWAATNGRLIAPSRFAPWVAGPVPDAIMPR